MELDMKRKIAESAKAALLEFEKEPMDSYYDNPLAGYPSRLRVRKILRELGDIRDRKVLDIGCEAGYISLKLLKKGAHPVSFDLCKPALKKFKEKLSNMPDAHAAPFVAIAQAIPLKSNSVDAVVCTEVLEHAPYADICIKEMARVVKPGGKVVITFPNEPAREKLYPIAKLLGVNTDVEKEVTLFSYKIDDILKECRKHFLVEKSYAIPWFYPITHVVVCRKWH